MHEQIITHTQPDKPKPGTKAEREESGEFIDKKEGGRQPTQDREWTRKDERKIDDKQGGKKK